MTNKETLSALILMRDNCVNKREYNDPMREIKQRALEAAIKAIDNQERMQRELKSLDGIAETCDKLEKALELACDKISCLYCVLHDVHPCEETHEQCVKRKVQYFKRLAGIEIEEIA